MQMRALSAASDWLWPDAQPFPDRLDGLSVIGEGRDANTASRFSAPACRSARRILQLGCLRRFSSAGQRRCRRSTCVMEGLRGGLRLAGLLSLLLVAGGVQFLIGLSPGRWIGVHERGQHTRVNDISLYDVILGSYQLTNPSPDIQVEQIDQVIKHPDFNEEEGSQGDVALVKLKFPVLYSRTVRPICLPASSVSFPEGMTCTVTGWGHIRETTSLPSPMTLQQLEVPIIGLDTCRCLYRRNPDPEDSHTLHRDMMCAGFVDGKKDACQGDSGSPLSCLVDNAWFLAGIVSWGYSCGAANRPGVYIQLPFYANWIKENVPEVQLQQVTVPTKPALEEALCSNSTREGGGAYDDIQPLPGWNHPLNPKNPPNSSVSLAYRVGLPLILLLLQACLW
ncbi:Prostasin, partial [Ophiophagus hannah]